MFRRRFLASLVLASLGATASATELAPYTGDGAGDLAYVQVIDRTTGARLPIYRHEGKRYVAGTPGNRYSIVVHNRSAGRVMAVVSVDGVNVVTGETASWTQNGYVFSPWLEWEIRGWRKSQDRIAAFEFTALPDSYAARTGRPDNVGVIGVALFREASRPRVEPPHILRPGAKRDDAYGATGERRESASPGNAGGTAGASPADPRRLHSGDAASEAARDGSAAERASSPQATAPSWTRTAPAAAGAPVSSRPPASTGYSAPAAAELPDGRFRDRGTTLGTGHGRSETSWVSYTTFRRARSTPDEVITIRYDSRENLVALGVIAPHYGSPQPFPSNVGFVPDPPR